MRQCILMNRSHILAVIAEYFIYLALVCMYSTIVLLLEFYKKSPPSLKLSEYTGGYKILSPWLVVVCLQREPQL